MTALGALAAGALCVFALMFVGLLASSQAASCDGGEAGLAPSAVALADIPGNYLAAYVAAAATYKLDWAILAAVGKVETDHGRSRLPGVQSGTNASGAAGPMQFLLTATWPSAGVDGNADGVKNVYDFRDAIPAAAKYLRAGGAPADWRRAIFSYNHAGWYVDQVLAQGDAYRATDDGSAGVGGALSLPEGSQDAGPASGPTGAAGPTGDPAVGGCGSTDDGGGDASIQVPDAGTRLQKVVAAANALAKRRVPYCYGGGHVTPAKPTTTSSYCVRADKSRNFGSGEVGMDCSSSVSFVLQRAGSKIPTLVSGAFGSVLKPGPGEHVSVFYNDGHIWMSIDGHVFQTSVYNYRNGPGWTPARSPAGFAVGHPEGL